MKNLFKNLMLVAVAAMAFTACQNEPEMDINAVEKTVITFDAKFEDTRSAFGELNGETETFSSYWDGNEVAKFNHWSVSNGNFEDVNVTIDSEDRFVVEFAREIDNTHTIDAYVPASAWGITKSDWELDSNDNPYYTDVYREYTIPAEQNPTATSVDPKAHILKASVVFDSSNSYSLVFKHQVAYGKLNLKNFAGTGVTSYVLDINGDMYVINSENTTGVWFACKPAEVENMTLSVVASEGTYTKPLVENGNKTLEFVKGQVAEFTVNMVDVTTGEAVDTFNPGYLATSCEWKGSYFLLDNPDWPANGDYIFIYLNEKDRPNNNSILPGTYYGMNNGSASNTNPAQGQFSAKLQYNWDSIFAKYFTSSTTLVVSYDATTGYTILLTDPNGRVFGYRGMPDGWVAPAAGGTPEPEPEPEPDQPTIDLTGFTKCNLVSVEKGSAFGTEYDFVSTIHLQTADGYGDDVIFDLIEMNSGISVANKTIKAGEYKYVSDWDSCTMEASNFNYAGNDCKTTTSGKVEVYNTNGTYTIKVDFKVGFTSLKFYYQGTL